LPSLGIFLRQPKAYLRPAPLLTLDLDTALVLFHDLLYYGKTQTHTKAFGAEQGFEDLRL
jgi:hypothetical protein